MSIDTIVKPVADVEDLVADMVLRTRTAQASFEHGADQIRYDMAALAIGWALLDEARNRELSEMAVATTGLGNVNDKIRKNHRKTLGLLRDIAGQKTHGEISHDDAVEKAARIMAHQGSGHSIDENLNYRHFMNTTKVVRPIASREPSVGEIFSGYWTATQQSSRH